MVKKMLQFMIILCALVMFRGQEVKAWDGYPELKVVGSSEEGVVRFKSQGCSCGCINPTQHASRVGSTGSGAPSGASGHYTGCGIYDDVPAIRGININMWYEARCSSHPLDSSSINMSTYVEEGGKLDFNIAVSGCGVACTHATVTVTHNETGRVVYSQGFAAGNTGGYTSNSQLAGGVGTRSPNDGGPLNLEDHGKFDSSGNLIGWTILDDSKWKVASTIGGEPKNVSVSVPNLSAGTYSVKLSASISGRHPTQRNIIGAWIYNLKLVQPYTAELHDVDNYDTANKIDLTYESDTKYNMQIPSEYTGSHWLRTINPYSKVTSGQSFPVAQRGSMWGTNTTANKYYAGYKYKSDSGNVSIAQYATKIVYRYFEPIRYKVNIHKNRPSNATYDVTPSTSGYTKISFSGEPANSVFQKEFVYNHTELEAPSTRFYLRGWSIADDENWYDTEDTNNPKYTVGSKTLTTTENAVLNLYPKYTPNKYTITYDTRVGSNSTAQSGSATTERTEVNGHTDYSHGAISNGLADTTGNGTGSGSKVNGKTKEVTFDSSYGTLLFPRAYWTTNIDANSSDDYITQPGTTTIPSGSSERSHNTYSTFKGWSINTGLTSKETSGTSESNYKPGSGATVPNSIFTTANGWWGTTKEGKVGLDKETKMQIDNDHTLYANWFNNPQKLGTPTRKYIVTFKDSDRSNIGEYINPLGGTVNNDKDLILEHS